MGIKFLKRTPENAVALLQEQARKGYAIRHSMKREHDDVGGASGVTDTLVADWTNRAHTWREETRQILLDVYESPNYMYKFIEIKPNTIFSTSEEERYTNIKDVLIQRVETLNYFIDFIINNSNVSFSIENNITYLNINPERDINVAGRDVTTRQ